MKMRHLPLLWIMSTGFLLGVARAQEIPVQATITAVTGSSSVRQADGSSGPAVVGLKLARGAVVTTEQDAQVSIEAHAGIVAVVTGASQVEVEKLSVSADGMRNTILNLRRGNLASSLDPARKSTNNYGVRTDRGLAMARGTTLTVSVNNNVYTVSVLVGSVTVNWAGGRSVNITGNTPASVTSNVNGQVNTLSLGAALSGNDTPGLTDALTAAVAAISTVATDTAQITSAIATIATAAGTSPIAATTVASVTAAAAGAAVNNDTLVAAAGGNTTSVAATISTAAVTSATAAGNASAAALIVTSAVNAVVNTIAGSNVHALATALANASNSVPGNTTVSAGLVTAGVHAAQNPATATGHPPANDRSQTAATTPITPIDPAISVSPSA